MSRLRNCGIAAGLASLAFASVPAWANTVEEPGETSGIAAYAPLPEGGYFLNLGNFGVRDTHPNTGLAVDIPALVWSTPVTVLGARLEFLVAQPVIDLNVSKTTSLYGVYYPFVQPILTWDLGGGFSFGGGVGAYLPIRNSVTKAVVGRITTVRFNAGINYIDKDWTLVATGAFGLPEGTDNENPGGHHQWAILDLTANYAIGKWTVGLGGYGSDDTSEPAGVPGYKQQAQFAVGPLVGYNFGPVILQAKLTRDVAQQNEGGFDTRFWTNVIIPLWGAPPPPPPPAAAPPPAPQAVEAPPTRTYLVFFDWDRADLSSRAQQIIGEAASASTHVHVTRIMCNGYTDTSGTVKYNLALSMRRANSVANELVKDGVPRDVIDIKGFGETHPLVQTGPGVREPQNRRVEIILG
jgi:outer membrane protein OmpA-like peptidoglycan-associated protein